MGSAHSIHAGRGWRACSVGVVVCGALALSATAQAKMICPMGNSDGSGQGTAAGSPPPGSDRAGTSGPLAPVGTTTPAKPAPGAGSPAPASAAQPSGRQGAQPAASSVPASVPATTSVPATAAASVPVAAATTVPAVAPVIDPQAQLAAERAAARRAAERRAARRAAARRAEARRAAKATLRARVMGKERYFAPGRGSAWVQSPADRSAPPVDRAPAELPTGLVLLALTGLGALVAIALRRRRGGDDAVAAASTEPPDPFAAAHAARIEAELQEIIAEERAARALQGPTAGGRR